MKRETLFLKAVVVLMGMAVLALCVFLVPEIANWIGEDFQRLAFLQYPLFIYLEATAIPFYFALYQTLKLLSYIDKNEAFSEISVKALKAIKNCAITISILYAACMPLVYIIAEVDDAPGLIIMGMFVTCAPIVIAVFAAVLQKLLQNAIDIKSENDLTI